MALPHLDPWAHEPVQNIAASASAQAANDTLFDDSKTKGNWTMLIAGIVGLIAIMVAVCAAGYIVGLGVMEAWPLLVSAYRAHPVYVIAGTVAAICALAGFVYWFVCVADRDADYVIGGLPGDTQ